MKRILSFCLALVLVLSLAGCSSGGSEGGTATGKQDTQADKGLEVMGENVTYDPNHLVNNGDPISIDWWIWASEDMFRAIADEYEEIHPNVTINIINNPWDGFFTKLPLALQRGEEGPTLYNIHNSYENLLLNYMEPYDIDTDELIADYPSASTHLMDGKIYYADYGLSTGMYYYNKALWKEAGLTDNDIPKTWDEFIEVAQKLTKFDENGNMIQAGYNYNNYFNSTVIGLNYQFGDNLFSEDGKSSLVDSDGMKDAVSFLVDLYDEYHVGDKDFGTNYDQSFYQGQRAIVFAWGFFVGNLATNAPDIDYGTFEIPTRDGETPYAYYRYNGESTPGINKNATDAQKEVAQDFIRFFLASDDVQIRLSQEGGLVPAKTSLMDAPELKDTPIVKTVGPHIDRYIWPGAMPSTVENNMKIAGEDILYNGKDAADALKTAADTIDIDLANADFTSSESLYAYYEK